MEIRQPLEVGLNCENLLVKTVAFIEEILVGRFQGGEVIWKTFDGGDPESVENLFNSAFSIQFLKIALKFVGLLPRGLSFLLAFLPLSGYYLELFSQ